MTLGIIGIGQLGLPVASNLLAAGFSVVGFRRTNHDPFVSLGGKIVGDPAAVAKESDCVILCLPSEAAELEALHGERGLLKALKPGQVVIEAGSYRQEFKLELARRIEDAGASVIECEISGSPSMVKEQRAALMLGGEVSLIESVKPILDAISPNQFRIGPFGSAVSMKLIANHLVAVHTFAAAEALTLAKRSGLDLAMAIEVIKAGAGASAMFSIRAPMMLNGTFFPAPGSFGTLEKYISLISDLKKNVACSTPLFDAAEPYYRQALAQGMAEQDIAAVINLIDHTN